MTGIHQDRPWGFYQNIDFSRKSKVKRIYVNPNSKFSLQYHRDREEHWIVVEGSGKLTLGEEVREVTIGEYIHIPTGTIHRLEGGKNGILIIEVQMGECMEDDIVRLDDDYGRIGTTTYC